MGDVKVDVCLKVLVKIWKCVCLWVDVEGGGKGGKNKFNKEGNKDLNNRI